MTSSALHKIAEAINNAEEHVLAPDELELAKFDRSDLGNAKRLVARFGRDLIFVDGIGWHRWDGQRWQSEGGESAALTVAHKTAIAIKDEAAALRDAYKDGTLKLDTDTDSGEKKKSTPWDAHLKFSVASGNINRSTGMLRQALPYKRKMAGDLDRGHLYFNVQNGTLELPSIAGSGDANLRIHHREDFISHLSPVSFDRAAVAPTFDAFIQAYPSSRRGAAFCAKMVWLLPHGDHLRTAIGAISWAGREWKIYSGGYHRLCDGRLR